MKSALACALLLPLAATAAGAAEFPVSDVNAFDEAVKKVKPGDVIVLASTEWRDADLLLRGQGAPDRPITLRATAPGTVVLTGASRLRLSGEHLHVEGIWFRDAIPRKGDLVSFREDSKRLARSCVLRNCAITAGSGQAGKGDSKWVSLYGAEHRVERCSFLGKSDGGTLLVVWLPKEQGEPVRHRIEKNYFGPRPRLGKNGGEIIRLGDSDTSLQRADCLVAGNLFERCDGEAECISNKSCGNVYRENVFLECRGTLTLRHGNACLVERNVFLGRHRSGTGGIRIIGEDHQVIGNYLHGLEGDGARSAICLVNGLVNSPLNGYAQVKRALVRDNLVVDCKHSIAIGFADPDVTAPLPPVDCEFSGNRVGSPGRRIVDLLAADARITWKDNLMWGAETGLPDGEGVRLGNPPADLPPPPEPPGPGETGIAWNLPFDP